MDINKEFEAHVVEQGYEDNMRIVTARKAYLAAAAPRDLLIEQLVKALKTAHSQTDQVARANDHATITAALSGAKERGYGS